MKFFKIYLDVGGGVTHAHDVQINDINKTQKK